MPETTNNSKHDVSIEPERGQPRLYGLTQRPPVQQILKDALDEARVAKYEADCEAYAAWQARNQAGTQIAALSIASQGVSGATGASVSGSTLEDKVRSLLRGSQSHQDESFDSGSGHTRTI